MLTKCKMYELLGAATVLLLVCGTQLNAQQLTLRDARSKALEARSKPSGGLEGQTPVPMANPQGTYTFFSFDVPTSSGTVLEGINSRGEMVGIYLNSNLAARYFVLVDGEFKPVGPPDTSPFNPIAYLATQAGIDSNGDIVGSYFNDSGPHGFLLKNGIYTDIDAPAAETLNAGTEPAGINPEGDIVGFYTDSNGISAGLSL